MWTVPEDKGLSRTTRVDDQKRKDVHSEAKDILGVASRAHHVAQTLDKAISDLEMELAAARALQDCIMTGSPITEDLNIPELTKKRKYLMVIGINTAFSSRKRRDSVRATWMPQGDKLKKLEEEKGTVMQFVIGCSATSGGILDKAIEAEENQHGDFLRLRDTLNYPPRQRAISLLLFLSGMQICMSKLMRFACKYRNTCGNEIWSCPCAEGSEIS